MSAASLVGAGVSPAQGPFPVRGHQAAPFSLSDILGTHIFAGNAGRKNDELSPARQGVFSQRTRGTRRKKGRKAGPPRRRIPTERRTPRSAGLSWSAGLRSCNSLIITLSDLHPLGAPRTAPRGPPPPRTPAGARGHDDPAAKGFPLCVSAPLRFYLFPGSSMGEDVNAETRRRRGRRERGEGIAMFPASPAVSLVGAGVPPALPLRSGGSTPLSAPDPLASWRFLRRGTSSAQGYRDGGRDARRYQRNHGLTPHGPCCSAGAQDSTERRTPILHPILSPALPITHAGQRKPGNLPGARRSAHAV